MTDPSTTSQINGGVVRGNLDLGESEELSIGNWTNVVARELDWQPMGDANSHVSMSNDASDGSPSLMSIADQDSSDVDAIRDEFWSEYERSEKGEPAERSLDLVASLVDAALEELDWAELA